MYSLHSPQAYGKFADPDYFNFNAFFFNFVLPKQKSNNNPEVVNYD